MKNELFGIQIRIYFPENTSLRGLLTLATFLWPRTKTPKKWQTTAAYGDNLNWFISQGGYFYDESKNYSIFVL